MLEVRNLTKTYKMGSVVVNALVDASFDVPEGRMICITGKSGSGKSTLLRQLGLLDRPTGGHILFEGQDVTRFSDSKRSSLRLTYLGYVFQEYALLQELTAHENVYLPGMMLGNRGIEAIDGVAAVTYRNSMGAELDYEDERTNCTVRGINPEREKSVFNIADAIYEGSYLEARDSDQILLGVQLAGCDQPKLELYSSSLKKVHVGDKVTVTYINGVKKQYRVKGIFYTEFIQTDLQAFVTEREFRSINPLSNDRASIINIKIRSDSSAPQIMAAIGKLRDNLQFKTWEDTAGIVKSMTDSFNLINAILASVNLLVAGITVFIVTYIDLANKRRQIGIERAIGITSLAITVSYVLRAVFYAVLGIIIARFLYKYAVVPLEASHPFRFPFGPVFLFISEAQMLRSALIILGVSVVAALLPVWQTIRIRLLDAIWG